MRLRWAGDDCVMRGSTALDCLHYHCHGDHSVEGQRGDVDGVMRRIAERFGLDSAYVAQTTLHDRCEAFVKAAIDRGLIVDLSTQAVSP